MDSLFNHQGTDAQTIPIDCKSPEGITIGLIDALMTIAAVIRERDITAEITQEALQDLSQDRDLRALIGD